MSTYSQIFIHIVFSVKHRKACLATAWRQEVFKYISAIISEKGHKSIIVNGVEDHVHIFLGMKPLGSLSDLVREIKSNSSRFINEKKWLKEKFYWQEGYGAFSYGQSQVKDVFNYILNQEEHHKKSTFQEEYISLLKKFEIEYDEKYFFGPE